MKVDKRIVLYVVAGLLVISLFVLTFFPNMIYAFKDAGANSGEDICSPPPGQSEEAWGEHMSHHPDIYRDCL